ncbi:ABC transporter substrate-binding protein [Cellulomonas marina]|uniref:NitT/TauT family transport system substrate-binding protein n=1 Tax=Cellulomonas marina TaxID=988821 RepID=A0A1I0XR10_9CELL|nr:ABC transporter substrate-binding protein [Cellulomonas marina]GIG30062.1 sulfonate ABC transporter substrate-binding protein [Cellulomonas marina]SFB02730.1 NitT/TauT family transport system substrate-binding protein [Cellulomonas marina]
MTSRQPSPVPGSIPGTLSGPLSGPLSRRTVLAGGLGALAVPLLAACSDDAPAAGATPGTAATLNLAYFANLTHAAALIGVAEGLFTAELGSTELVEQVVNAGPSAVEGLLGGSIDAAYIGPGPTINAHAQSDGQIVRIVAGATSGGASLVVRAGITSAEDLRGLTLASPQLGNTQDVALRNWLAEQGLETSVEGGGDVTIAPLSANADSLTLLQSGEIDGAWMPEPWATRLVLEAGGTTLVDERDLWPEGQFVTTHLVVRTEYLAQYPETVAALLRGHVAAVTRAVDDPAGAREVVNGRLEELTGSALSEETIATAWEHLAVTEDPVAASLQAAMEHAVTAGTLDAEVDLGGLYDLRPLNAELSAQGLEPVSAGGLGEE